MEIVSPAEILQPIERLVVRVVGDTDRQPVFEWPFDGTCRIEVEVIRGGVAAQDVRDDHRALRNRDAEREWLVAFLVRCDSLERARRAATYGQAAGARRKRPRLSGYQCGVDVATIRHGRVDERLRVGRKVARTVHAWEDDLTFVVFRGVGGPSSNLEARVGKRLVPRQCDTAEVSCANEVGHTRGCWGVRRNNEDLRARRALGVDLEHDLDMLRLLAGIRDVADSGDEAGRAERRPEWVSDSRIVAETMGRGIRSENPHYLRRSAIRQRAGRDIEIVLAVNRGVRDGVAVRATCEYVARWIQEMDRRSLGLVESAVLIELEVDVVDDVDAPEGVARRMVDDASDLSDRKVGVTQLLTQEDRQLFELYGARLGRAVPFDVGDVELTFAGPEQGRSLLSRAARNAGGCSGDRRVQRVVQKLKRRSEEHEPVSAPTEEVGDVTDSLSERHAGRELIGVGSELYRNGVVRDRIDTATELECLRAIAARLRPTRSREGEPRENQNQQSGPRARSDLECVEWMRCCSHAIPSEKQWDLQTVRYERSSCHVGGSRRRSSILTERKVVNFSDSNCRNTAFLRRPCAGRSGRFFAASKGGRGTFGTGAVCAGADLLFGAPEPEYGWSLTLNPKSVGSTTDRGVPLRSP